MCAYCRCATSRDQVFEVRKTLPLSLLKFSKPVKDEGDNQTQSGHPCLLLFDTQVFLSWILLVSGNNDKKIASAPYVQLSHIFVNVLIAEPNLHTEP